MKLRNGIHLIEGVQGANTYLIETDEAVLIVDAGMPGNADALLSFAEKTGHSPSDVSWIVLTHADIDHVGSAAELQKRTGAKVAIHEADADVLRRKRRSNKKGFFAFLTRMIGKLRPAPPVEPDVVLHGGEEIAGWKVLHVPGHTPGSIALQRGDVVVSGDALLGNREGGMRPPIKPLSEDWDGALASAEAVRALDPKLLLPGHGRPYVAK